MQYCSFSIFSVSFHGVFLMNCWLKNLNLNINILADFFHFRVFPGEKPIRFFFFIEWQKGTLQCWQHCRVSTVAQKHLRLDALSNTTSPLTFLEFEPWTSWQAQCPYPLGHGYSLICLLIYMYRVEVMFIV